MPVGVAAAIYLEEYAPKNWFTAIIEINVTNLAGVPSIVYGLLALGLFVYQFGLGQSIAAAGLTLALLILPIVIVATREAIRSVPKAIREAAYGLGATRWEVTKDHVLPYSTGGILTGMILGLSRAIGETAPIITIGALSFIAFLPESPVKSEFPFISFGWLNDPFTAMPIQMFNWVSRPDQAFQANAAAAGAILLGMTLLMNGRGDLDSLSLSARRSIGDATADHRMHTTRQPTRQIAAQRRIPPRRRFRAAPTGAPRISIAVDDTRKVRTLNVKAAVDNLNFYYGQHQRAEEPDHSDRGPAGHGADRPVGLRQEHVPALLQPHARSAAGHALRRQHHAASGQSEPGRPGRRSDRSAHAHRHGVPEAESVSRSRSSRTSPTACACAVCAIARRSPRKSRRRCAARRCGTK